MGYKFEENTEPNLSRNGKACLPTPWHFLSFFFTRCLYGSVDGHICSKIDLLIVMYGLFYDINVDYAYILWEDFLTFFPELKNKFLIHHPRWWSIIIHDVINNRNLTLEKTPKAHYHCTCELLCLRKKKRKHSDHASKKSAKKKKRLNSDQPPSIPSPIISNDNLGVDLDEPTSPPKFAPVSSASFQSIL
ncbi:unnamed protein product [Lactuca saligna]|uniref:Uncharacterized protein n=1 Tax=Lactuca saligna TaxID=75948 RepID=A0AA36ENB2_LACSI|nr:unnamed protein product [Lactuca saligna]